MCVSVVGCVILAGCGNSQPAPPGQTAQQASSSERETPAVPISTLLPSEAQQVNKKALAEIASAKEASTWLEDENHQVFNMAKQDAVFLVDQLYNAGAAKVWFTEIETAGDFSVSASLLVELPGEFDTERRSDVLEIDQRFYDERGQPATQDLGQDYLWLLFE